MHEQFSLNIHKTIFEKEILKNCFFILTSKMKGDKIEVETYLQIVTKKKGVL